jgi:hypothetical protein
VALALLAACDGGGGVDEGPGPLAWSAAADDWADGALLSVWAGGPDDVWIAGGEAGRGVVLHFDGAAWERRDPPGADAQLWWVHGFAGGQVFVSGDRGLVARWDGAAWTVDDTGHPGTTLYGVWGAAPDDVWAVGGVSLDAEPAEQEGDVVLHWDGAAWTRADVPPLANKPSSAQKNLYKVWGTAADDVWVVGGAGTILHWDGTSWEPHDAGLGSTLFFTVTGRARDDVWVVGGFGVAALVHFDGASWAEVELPPEAPSLLQGVWTAPGRPVYVSGLDGFTARFDGDSWTLGEALGSTPGLHAIAEDGGGAVWAVGGNILTHLADHTGHVRVSGRQAPPLP